MLLATSAAIADTPVATHPSQVDWDTYGFDAARDGFNASENRLGPTNVHRLRRAWSVKIGGVMNTQPLYAASVLVRTRRGRRGVVTKDLVIGATDRGRVAAVDAATGKKVWQRSVGYLHINCGDLPYYGITGTPTIDRATNSVYVGDGRGRVDRLDLSTGRTKHRWTVTHNPASGHMFGALTLVGRVVYAVLAGPCDHPPYRGEIAAINTRNGHIKRWFVAPGGGGIWGFGGISADPHVGALYAATGNSIGTSDHDGYAERVVRLTNDLRVTASNYPGLPAVGDADFGATPMLYRAPGCPPQLAVGNKHGTLYVYDRDRIGSGPVQRIGLGGSSFGGEALIGVDAYLPSERTVYVSNPHGAGRYHGGILAFRVTGGCHLALRWQARGPGFATSSPTVANGVVFYGTGGDGRVMALDARTGKRLWVHSVGHAIFGAPSVVNGAVYLSASDGRLRAFVPK